MRSGGPGVLRALAFFGGGSGGHLFPGIAVAERARERFPGCRLLFFRTPRAVESRVFAESGFPTRTLPLEAPAGGARGWLRFTRQALRALPEIRRELRGGFDAALGLGGYASLPGIIAARLEGVPVVLLEQNRVPGRVTRLLAPFAGAVSCPDAAAAGRLRGRREVTGNPVRRQVLEAALERRERRGRPRNGRKVVLVAGGSQGASGLNRAIAGALPALAGFREKIQWIHLSGQADKAIMERAYLEAGFEAQVLAYSPELPRLMARSDLVIGRAGGTTLAEIAVLGVPAVLVPYPHHRDRHQLENARALAEAGGAEICLEGELGAPSLERIFEELLGSPGRLEIMEAGAASLARPDAADRVLDLVLELRKACPQVSASSC
jgi:UDP-N-acetylglucosamine--N-acetylmuramyl-(pentapeptide) pyrophosphoryl-undecaprenol N-acetylglucosamine transferase